MDARFRSVCPRLRLGVLLASMFLPAASAQASVVPAPPAAPTLTAASENEAGERTHRVRTLAGRLRVVQRRLARMQRRLAASGEPPRRSIRRLRRTLERVTPLVERRLGGAARPDPGLRAVRRRVHRARASADLVIGLILRSELHGREVRRLLTCLRRFRGPFAVLVPQPDPAPPDRLVPARTSMRAA